ncbi:hypothetical protein QTJ16_003602 [Diplocarpon rosae]|uniref:Bromo domain-containing protein n=1 Tax=Diplocarpon rosae TaxID=946125 RepID=A0AAD9T1H3_9HELO|nr:hypothetical protein QTJ16_003602 [Diplocarpon rosae]PBP15416.1 WD domain containing protein [Diplocarpon rosae]
MNSVAATYTPLECLLLFQTLVVYGAEEQDFERISSLLTSNALVKDAETYDAQRLSADALRTLYLRLLHDELKGEEDAQEDQTSRKRKLPTPPLPSIKDALEYREKLPSLVNRLYARYREHMIRVIQEDERRYANIQKEIGEIERGEWDERILEQSVPTNGIAKEDLKNQDQPAGQPSKAPETSREQSKSSHPSPRPEGLAINDVLNGANAKPSSPRLQEPSRIPGFPPPLSRPGSIGPHGPSPLQTPVPAGMEGRAQQAPGSHFQPPLQQGPNYTAPHNGQPGQYTWEPPFAPPPMKSGHAYPFNGQHQQYPQYPPPHHHQEQFSSPRGVPPPPIHVPSSPINQQPHPIVLPPPNGAARQPGSPAMQLDALADAAGQQYRASVGSPMIQQGRPSGSPVSQQGPIHGSPMMQHGFPGPPLVHSAHVPSQHGSVNSPVLPSPHGFPFTPQQRSPSVNGPPQWSQQQPMPFPSPSQQHAVLPHQRLPFQPPPNLVPSQGKAYNSPYNPHQDNRSQPLRPNFPQTPLLRSHQHKTGSGTIWTPTPTGATPARGAFDVSESPAIEPLSPILRPANLPGKKTPKKKIDKKFETPKTMQSVEQPRQEPKPKGPRRELARPRAGSVASSVFAGSHRSQSVMSHADELSLDNEALHRIKQEVATPVGGDESGHTTADEQARPPPAPSPRHSMKRKRGSSNLIKAPTPVETKPSAPPTHVRWTRAFPNISKSALEAIAGHRNASTFSDPVKEKYAPGYKQIVIRAQDLKSIRTAITAGHRAATAAAPDDLPANAPTAWLEISEDLIPPKGIINYAQLEKELMRMFANAIMFNPDPDRGLGRRWQGIGKDKGDVVGYEIDEDGVVKDTKAMFADVEKIVGSLRSAERRSEEMRESSMARAAIEDDDDADELAGDGDPPAGNTGTIKRRKKG